MSSRRDYIDSIWEAVKEWESFDPLLEDLNGFMNFYEYDYTSKEGAIYKLGEYLSLSREAEKRDISIVEVIFSKSQAEKAYTRKIKNKPKRERVEVKVMSKSQSKALKEMSERFREREKELRRLQRDH